MSGRTKKHQPLKGINRSHAFEAADERGYAGQHGQRPANEEEKQYRPDAVKSEERHK